MRVVLALPPFNLSRSYGGAGFKGRGFLPPLGVAHIAAYVEPRGHKITLIDSPAQGFDVEMAASAILAAKPEVIGISCLTKLSAAAYALATTLKAQAPEIPIVMGGAHVTSFWEQILGLCSAVDFLVPGEGEIPFAELLDCLEQGRSTEGVSGIVYRGKDGESITTSPRACERNLDVFPHPARHIFRHDLYVPLPNQCRRTPATTVITSRGCSYGQCKFCYQGGQYGSVYRRRSPEHVVDEVARLCRDYGIKEVIFSDDNFGINSKWIGTFCDLLDEEKLDITWTMQSRVNTVTKEMLHRMAASGCYNVYFGFESGSQYMLDLVKKGITLDQSRQAVKWAKSAGMEIRGSFIMGMPTETREMAKATIKFACELNADWVMFYPYHVQAGTALAELAARNGVISEELENIHLPSYISSTYGTVEELSKTLRSAYIAYYLRPRYFARALWRARDPRVLRNNFEAFKFWLSLTFKSSH